MRFEVPQFIEIEDKIFGPLTWRQFLYLGGGVGMGVVIFLTFGLLVGLLVGVPLALLAGALSFYPVNNRPFSYFLEAIVGYIKGTKLYLWQRKRSVIYKQDTPHHPSSTTKLTSNQATSSPASMPLARRLELELIQKNEQ